MKKLAGFFSHPTFFSEEFDQHRRPVQPAEAHFKCCIFGIHEGAVARMNCEYHWSLFYPQGHLYGVSPLQLYYCPNSLTCHNKGTWHHQVISPARAQMA